MNMKKSTYLEQSRAIAPELLSLRAELHRHPELGNREFRTAERIETYLAELGIPTCRLLDTAVVGTLHGGSPGKICALRADMDALPIQEDTSVPFASEIPGVMHACGHDVHTAAALGAAALLSENRDQLQGTVRFLFQPDEEGDGGARRMVEAGCLEGVSAVFGCHVSPALPAGSVGVRYGKFYAASDVFSVTVRGKSSHGAERENGIDALGAAAEMVTELLKLPRSVLPERAVLTVGTLHAGTKENILSDRADFSGILRSLGPAVRETLRNRIEETLDRISAAWGTDMEKQLRASYGGVVNTDAETKTVQSAAEALLGRDRVCVLDSPTMTTEDFGYFVEAAGAGCFYHIGAGCTAPLHSPTFLPADDALVTAAAVHAAVITEYLSQK